MQHRFAQWTTPGPIKFLAVAEDLDRASRIAPELNLDAEEFEIAIFFFQIAGVFDVINEDHNDIGGAELLPVERIGMSDAIAPAQIAAADRTARLKAGVVFPFDALRFVR